MVSSLLLFLPTPKKAPDFLIVCFAKMLESSVGELVANLNASQIDHRQAKGFLSAQGLPGVQHRETHLVVAECSSNFVEILH